MLKEELYLSPKYSDRESLEKEILFWDATSSDQVARCPRNAEYFLREGLRQKEEAVFLRAGGALHGALSVYYAGGSQDESLEELRRVWGRDASWRPSPTSGFSHLHLGFLEVVLKNYFDFAERRDTFKAIVMKKSELNLKNVVAAVWRLLPDDNVVLGESKIVMEFDLDGKKFVYSGKPDLPIIMGGAYYVMDHKSTSSYLSTWYFDRYKFSNQLRGYCAMIQELTGLQIDGAYINGLYTGEKAAETEFKGSRFARYGPMLFQPGHLTEAIKNQRAWRQALDYYEQAGYYPQHASRECTNCQFATLCASSPAMRNAVMEQHYIREEREFLDL